MQGGNISSLGHESDPWLVEARLLSGPAGATLLGEVSVPYLEGKADFQSLAVSSPGGNYEIQFFVTGPTNVPVLVANSTFFM